jgi:hypothetical protein
VTPYGHILSGTNWDLGNPVTVLSKMYVQGNGNLLLAALLCTRPRCPRGRRPRNRVNLDVTSFGGNSAVPATWFEAGYTDFRIIQQNPILKAIELNVRQERLELDHLFRSQVLGSGLGIR